MDKLWLGFVVGHVALFAVFVFGAARIRNRSRWLLVKKLSLLGSALVLLSLTFEIVFSFFVTQSTGQGFVLVSQRWWQRYWKPLNSHGYRDKEITAGDVDGKKVLWVVGDSFVAGQGINRAEDRFSNILQRDLGQDWVVVNIAKCGWNTGQELDAMRQYPHKPHAIVLSYLVNDIDGVAENLGVLSNAAFQPTRVEKLLQHSYYLNYLYYRFFRFRSAVDSYLDYLKRCYDSGEVWQAHQQELVAVAAEARKLEAPLIVLLFPIPQDVEGSRPHLDKVAAVMTEHGAATLDVAKLLAGRSPRDMIVNAMDGHPNEAVNRDVADALLPMIKGLRLSTARLD